MSKQTATLRAWLTESGFDWSSGHIVLAKLADEEDALGARPQVERYRIGPESGWSDPLLDDEFRTSFGGCEATSFIAKDGRAIYFVGTYDGSSWCEHVVIDLDHYLDVANEMPQVGGG